VDLSEIEKALVGSWSGTNRGREFIIDLNADRSFFERRPDQQRQYGGTDTWRVDGNDLIVDMKQPDGRHTVLHHTFRLEGSQLDLHRHTPDVIMRLMRIP
jgi:hypothetical protein